jgi:subtilisin family serine protease
MKKLIIILILAIFGCTEEPIQETPILKSAKVEQQIIVKFKDATQITVGTVKKQIGDITVLSVKDSVQALKQLKQDKNVIYAHPDYQVQTCEVSNDPYYLDGTLWGMKSIGADKAWLNNTGSSEVVVAVIDEGYMYFHEDLIDNAWVNPNDIEDGIDNDGNGYVDDLYGWDFMHEDNTIYDGTYNYFSGYTDNHGTHVAGTIGAKGGNGIGVVGVNWNVKIISGKFLESSGKVSDAIEAIYYMIDLKKRGVNIVAINASWSMFWWGKDRFLTFPQGLYDAVMDAGKVDILFVCAAANNGLNLGGNDHCYPAMFDCPNLISVGAIDANGEMAIFSNYGRYVNLFAPGVSILSTIGQGYSLYNGTSMASPHVCGAAALYKSIHPTATALQIKDAILNNVVISRILRCESKGRLDISNF